MGKGTIHAILLLINFLLINNSFAQQHKNIPDYLKERFLNYTKAVPREEIYIHTDREEFISGEDLWFSTYLFDRQSTNPSLKSRIVYFELLNAENKPVLQKRILMDRGFGAGQVILPDTLSSGFYIIRAYTNWMKNFLPLNCFMKEIKINNALSTNLFKAKIHNVNLEKEKAIKNSELTFTINNSKPDILELFINTNNKYRVENNDHFNIFIQTHGNINHISTEAINGETTIITIPKANLNEGINQITLFDSRGMPVAEKYIYTPIKVQNVITLHSPDSCNLRSKIFLDLKSAEKLSTDLNSVNLSISIAPKTNSNEMIDLDDYMVLGSEFGIEPWNAINGRKIKQLSSEVMDSILANYSSNWINWEEILNKDLHHFKYQFENQNHFIFGKLTNSNHVALSDEIIIMNIPGKSAIFQYARTDRKGNFTFNLHIDNEIKDLIIMPDKGDKNFRIDIESSFSDQFFPSTISINSIYSQVSPYISKFSVNFQVNKIYSISSRGESLTSISSPVKSTRFYGKPDVELIMADYISLPVMEEVFFELLPYVSMKRNKLSYEILITDRVDNSPYVLSPCLMIDGVIIKDPSLIINLNPEIVEKIDVIKEKYVVGQYFFPGIINVITKSADFDCIPLPDHMIRLPYRITEPVSTFFSPNYLYAEKKNSHIPDYRNTLYWNPSVKADKEGKIGIEFWSSDNKSDYLINIQGITNEGQAFSVKKSIKVK